MKETDKPVLEAPSWFLKEWRLHLGRSQEWVADRCGLHKGDISALERGKIRWNEDHLEKVAKALGIPRWWLIGLDPSDDGAHSRIQFALAHLPKDRAADVLKIIEALTRN